MPTHPADSFETARAIPLLVSFLAASGILRLVLLPAIRARFLDHPNERSLHSRSVPRVGGLGIVGAVLLAASLQGTFGMALGLAAALGAVSLLDDWKGLPARVRFVAHALAASVFVLVTPPGEAPLVALALVLATIWMANLYNFMDGADGLAGGMAVFGFAAYGVAGNGGEVGALSWVVALAAAAFLLVNFPPARMFMGDVGSIPLGFLAAALGIAGWQGGHWPLWFPLVVFSPFVLDASVTLARRAMRGEQIWKAHRSHYYQRLVLMGWSHRRLALTAYALMAVSAGSALLAHAIGGWVGSVFLVALAFVYLLVALAIDGRWRRHAKA